MSNDTCNGLLKSGHLCSNKPKINGRCLLHKAQTDHVMRETIYDRITEIKNQINNISQNINLGVSSINDVNNNINLVKNTVNQTHSIAGQINTNVNEVKVTVNKINKNFRVFRKRLELRKPIKYIDFESFKDKRHELYLEQRKLTREEVVKYLRIMNDMKNKNRIN